jgi:2'-5' RNA ligase
MSPAVEQPDAGQALDSRATGTLLAAAAERDDTAAGRQHSWAGVVVDLPEPLAGELRTWRTSFGDKLADVVPPHITLVTTTPVRDWDETVRHVRRVAAGQAPFTVRIAGTGSFRPVSPVVYLNVVEGFAECLALHEKLQLGPLKRDLPFPFHPHITVAHDVGSKAMDEAEQRLSTFEASFPVTGMGLYEHDGSGIWLLREELSFGATSKEAVAGHQSGGPGRPGQAPA